MPHYYFDIRNGHRLIDPSGLDCLDDKDAVVKARAIAAQIALETSEGQRKISILNDGRQEIASVPVHPKQAVE